MAEAPTTGLTRRTRVPAPSPPLGIAPLLVLCRVPHSLSLPRRPGQPPRSRAAPGAPPADAQSDPPGHVPVPGRRVCRPDMENPVPVPRCGGGCQDAGNCTEGRDGGGPVGRASGDGIQASGAGGPCGGGPDGWGPSGACILCPCPRGLAVVPLWMARYASFFLCKGAARVKSTGALTCPAHCVPEGWLPSHSRTERCSALDALRLTGPLTSNAGTRLLARALLCRVAGSGWFSRWVWRGVLCSLLLLLLALSRGAQGSGSTMGSTLLWRRTQTSLQLPQEQ